ncbi:protein kinase domain-containing protein [Haematococcus lacustris]|uniref:Protein kinase domain-containing protein n=1 Tax=Haematococcus lacustris TaxID=44745 RepID=A0A699ZRD0_HAELA|nr:protein kinase domain-containing protein [Haematococcus lacustris]
MQVKLAGSGSLKGARRKTSFQVSRSPIASSSARRIGALISGLQDKVQEAQRYQLQARASFVRHEELSCISISAKIGTGGFGACYRALYQGAELSMQAS